MSLVTAAKLRKAAWDHYEEEGLYSTLELLMLMMQAVVQTEQRKA